MKIVVAILPALAVTLGVSMAFANPALLPKHPGYPGGKDQSPVTGQPLSNDPGQTNMGGNRALDASVESSGRHTEQHLADPNNERIKSKEAGAGRLPEVQGPQIKIEPPVKEATRMNR